MIDTIQLTHIELFQPFANRSSRKIRGMAEGKASARSFRLWSKKRSPSIAVTQSQNILRWQELRRSIDSFTYTTRSVIFGSSIRKTISLSFRYRISELHCSRKNFRNKLIESAFSCAIVEAVLSQLRRKTDEPTYRTYHRHLNFSNCRDLERNLKRDRSDPKVALFF